MSKTARIEYKEGGHIECYLEGDEWTGKDIRQAQVALRRKYKVWRKTQIANNKLGGDNDDKLFKE